MSDDNNDIDDIDDGVLAAIVSTVPGLPSTASEDADRFAGEVRRLVENRATKGWPFEQADSQTAVFVMVDYPRLVVERISACTVFDLPDVNMSLFGRIFFLTRDASNGGHIEFPCKDAEIINWLEDNGFEQAPIVIAHKGTMKMSIRRCGIADDAIHEVIRDKPPKLTISELQDALDHFHLDRLVSPTQCGPGIWESKRARQYVPVHQAEKAIQSKMGDLLSGWFRGLVRVEAEDSTPVGRIDIRLLSPSDGDAGLHYWAIIELKVAKSFRNAPFGSCAKTVSESTNIDDIVEGVIQADSYRAIRELKDGFLEVFDMRKDKSVNLLKRPAIVTAIDKCGGLVHCKLRPMYGSAREARTAGLLL